MKAATVTIQDHRATADNVAPLFGASTRPAGAFAPAAMLYRGTGTIGGFREVSMIARTAADWETMWEDMIGQPAPQDLPPGMMAIMNAYSDGPDIALQSAVMDGAGLHVAWDVSARQSATACAPPSFAVLIAPATPRVRETGASLIKPQP